MTVPVFHAPLAESPFYETLEAARALPDDQRRLTAQFRQDGFVVIDLLDETDSQIDAIRAGVEPLYRGNRVQDAWRRVAPVRDLAGHPRILDTLRILYGREPFPFQTLNFRTGSQQGTHADTFHFSSVPERFM